MNRESHMELRGGANNSHEKGRQCDVGTLVLVAKFREPQP